VQRLAVAVQYRAANPLVDDVAQYAYARVGTLFLHQIAAVLRAAVIDHEDALDFRDDRTQYPEYVAGYPVSGDDHLGTRTAVVFIGSRIGRYCRHGFRASWVQGYRSRVRRVIVAVPLPIGMSDRVAVEARGGIGRVSLISALPSV